MGADGLPNTFVPGRNLLFLTFAAALAYRRGVTHSSAACARPTIPAIPIAATRPSSALQAALILGMARPFELHTPLMWIDKAATWTLAHDLGGEGLIDLILEETHTCYLGERAHGMIGVMAAASARRAICGRRGGGSLWRGADATYSVSSPALCAIAHWSR